MNEQIKERAGIVYNVVQNVILLVSVGLTVWACNTVITHGNVLASQGTKLDITSSKVDRMEVSGSSGLGSYSKATDEKLASQDKRIEKLETAVIGLQSAPGELKAIAARLDNLKEGQDRIEKAMDRHLSGNGKSNP